MKFSRKVWVFCILCVAGLLVGWLLSLRPGAPEPGPLAMRHLAEEAEPVRSGPEKPKVRTDEPQVVDITFPGGAIQGEIVVHFENREDFFAYLGALNAAGVSPLGRIDPLLAVRISEDALRAVDPGRYGARASFSYTVERPPPPQWLNPAALAALRPFGKSARGIVEMLPQGDGRGVTVAILDSGIQSHSQFDGSNIAKLDISGSGVSGPGAEHGTSVASIISGREGIVPNVELLVVRVLNEEGLGNSYHVAEGIIKAVDRGADVVNLSLGVYQDTPLLRQAVDYAVDRGVLLVAAAGNDGYDRLPYPAAYDGVLAVTALDADGSQAIFPNQSEKIDFAAPGVGVWAAGEDGSTILFSGTSAAAPFISGTLASLMSGERAMAPSAAVELLNRYLNDSGAPGIDPVYGAGAVDWDRLRERSTPGILDVALAGIHLSENALPGTTMPLEVTVQNRGTSWFNKAELEVWVDGSEPLRFTIGTLGPGQTTTRKVFTQVPSAESDEPVALIARVLPEDINEDVRPENNLKAVQFRSRQD